MGELKNILNDDYILEIYRSDNSGRALELLMQKYQEKIYWHVRRMVLVHEDAADITQNFWIKVWENLGKFKGDSKLYTWLYRIATNESLNFIRKRKNKKTVALQTDEYDLSAELKADPYFEGDEMQKKILAAIDSLPEKQKIVFNLRYYDEMKYDDMSEVLETSVGGLKASYHHAVKKVEAFIKNLD